MPEPADRPLTLGDFDDYAREAGADGSIILTKLFRLNGVLFTLSAQPAHDGWIDSLSLAPSTLQKPFFENQPHEDFPPDNWEMVDKAYHALQQLQKDFAHRQVPFTLDITDAARQTARLPATGARPTLAGFTALENCIADAEKAYHPLDPICSDSPDNIIRRDIAIKHSWAENLDYPDDKVRMALFHFIMIHHPEHRTLPPGILDKPAKEIRALKEHGALTPEALNTLLKDSFPTIKEGARQKAAQRIYAMLTPHERGHEP